MTGRLRDATTSLVVLVAVGAAASGLVDVVWSGPWVARTWFVLLAVGAVVVAVRALLARRVAAEPTGPAVVVPTLAGLGAAVVLWFALGTAGDAEAARELPSVVSRTLVEAGRLYDLAYSSVAPVDATAPVTTVIIGVALLVFLLGDAAAVVARLPVLAVLLPGILWIPPLVVVGHVPLASLVALPMCLLLLLALDRAAPRRGTSPSTPATPPRGTRTLAGTATGVATVVAVAALVTSSSVVAGSALGAVRGGSDNPLASIFGSGGSGRLGNDLDVLQDLGDRPEAAVLTMSSSKDLTDVGPLRLYTLTDFDGSTWSPEGQRLRNLPVVERGETTGAGPAATKGPAQSVRITPQLLPAGRLAVPTEPRAVTSGARVRYDVGRDELYVDPGAGAYTLAVRSRGLTAKALAADHATFPPVVVGVLDPSATDAGTDAAGSLPEQQAALTVPASSHRDDIAALARQVTSGATSDYQRAVLVQNYLRNPAAFTYSTKAPRARTGDAVWDFLLARSGYCVQYATSMAIMLRTLGLPTRLGVGYLVHPSGDGKEATVRGVDAHAWTEVWFASAGWVRFDATPAVQSGSAPSWTQVQGGNSSDAQGAVPQNRATDVPTAGAGDGAAATPSPTSTTAVAGPGPRPWVPPVTGLLVVALTALGTVLARRRAARRQVVDAEAAWDRVTRRLAGLGVVWPGSTTPRQTPDVVAAAVHDATGRPLGSDAVRALRTLARRVESSRYARRAPELDPVELANLVDDVVAGVQAAVSGRRRSGDAPSAPRGGS